MGVRCLQRDILGQQASRELHRWRPVMDQTSLMMPHQCDAMSGEQVSIQHACTLLHLLLQFDRHGEWSLCAAHLIARGSGSCSSSSARNSSRLRTIFGSLPLLRSFPQDSSFVHFRFENLVRWQIFFFRWRYPRWSLELREDPLVPRRPSV